MQKKNGGEWKGIEDKVTLFKRVMEGLFIWGAALLSIVVLIVQRG